MEMETYTYKDLKNIFRIDEKVARQTIFNAEERQEIPRATRVQRGQTSVRKWTVDQLPAIGQRFGFLKPAKQQEIITLFTQKGGTLKSTVSYTLARVLALNGIKTIVIGLDTQCSITNVALPAREVSSLEELKEMRLQRGGLYHLLEQESVSLADVLIHTDLPTLDMIPETGHLGKLERVMDQAVGREQYFTKKLIPLLADYQVVIFDNSPAWNHLVKASLACATTVISPLGCDAGTIDVIESNMETVKSFKENADLEWRNFLMLPTLIEPNKLSQQIYGGYLTQFPEYIIPHPIRRAVVGQEAQVVKKSVLEYGPNTQLAADYYRAICAIWERICVSQAEELQVGVKERN